MYNSNQNYPNKKENKKRKALLALLFLVCSVLLFAGIVSAFFSDIISQPSSMKAGTLTLSGTYEYYLNDSQTALTDIDNLNPGDVVVIRWTVTNTGSKSAWIRDELSFASNDLLPYLEIYEGAFSREDIAAGDLSDSLITVPESGSVVSSVRVINGTGVNAETESGGNYNYVGDSKYTVTLTVYFMHTAGNEAQGKELGLTMSAKAIQFRNNDAAVPDNGAWVNVPPAIAP